ncbi:MULTISPECIES: lysozyme [Yersinia pseudotuberculosis complex]|uniref:Lysozyme n=1 Tax=Yersinia similis TaxID=367190 RepID=A0A0T9PST2_9GAMM|nr:lysozyme [Yersinia similis]BET62878.1 lysozyme [Yersinia pseudotuberculosis]CNB09628.1 lysozyme [Yersinia similis]CNF44531.1 lysozyme [Yersinia similis]CNG45567.1 lysozyme [Yersinia similis]CNH79906.1 lysozyme [Yersinia similis]
MASTKTKISAAVLGLVIAGVPASIILSQFLDEKEGNRLTAYLDGKNIWTICRGVTRVDGKPVMKGMRLTAEKCSEVNKLEADNALAWVEQNVQVTLTEPQKAGIASFCPYNIGLGKCFTSTFYRKLNAGDQKGACAEIKRWVRDGGKDCNIRSNNCYGQIERRAQESELTCWGLDE